MELGKQHQQGPQNSYPISARGLEGFNNDDGDDDHDDDGHAVMMVMVMILVMMRNVMR